MITRPLARDDGPVVEALFGANGACGGCWCQFFRLSGPEFKAGKGDANRARFLEQIADGTADGVLAFDGDRAVGWCAVAPRTRFHRIETGRSYRRTVDPDTWSLNCFYVPRAERGKGVARALLDAAVAHAFASGATEVEAYPVTPKADGSLPAAFAYPGVVSMFQAAGFAQVEGKTWVRSR